VLKLIINMLKYIFWIETYDLINIVYTLIIRSK